MTVFAGCLFPESDGTKKLEEETSDRVHIIKLDVTSDAVVEQAKQSVTKILTEKNLGSGTKLTGTHGRPHVGRGEARVGAGTTGKTKTILHVGCFFSLWSISYLMRAFFP